MSTKKTGRIIAASLIIATLSGCTMPTSVEVPPAHIGKLSTESGLQDGIIQPSKFRLEGFCYNCDNLILAEASDYGTGESMKIYMPKDELNLQVDVRGVFSISAEEANVEMVFARITATRVEGNNRMQIIPMTKVYNTYAQPVIRSTIRAILTKYTIAQVMENRDTISHELSQEVRSRLSSTPITTIRFGLADVQPPAVIVSAREAAKEREIAIQRAEADKQVSLKEAEAALEVAVKQQEVDLKEAETQVMVNKKLAEGVNNAFVTQRWLKIMNNLASNPDGRVIILPYEAIKNPSLLMGTFNQALSNSMTVKTVPSAPVVQQ